MSSHERMLREPGSAGSSSSSVVSVSVSARTALRVSSRLSRAISLMPFRASSTRESPVLPVNPSDRAMIAVNPCPTLSCNCPAMRERRTAASRCLAAVCARRCSRPAAAVAFLAWTMPRRARAIAPARASRRMRPGHSPRNRLAGHDMNVAKVTVNVVTRDPMYMRRSPAVRMNA